MTSNPNSVAKNKPVMPPQPVANAKAAAIEKKITIILKRLIKKAYASCTDTPFRADYEKAMEFFQDYQSITLQDYPLKVTCGPQCGVCCFHWAEDTYSFEVQYIADYLRKNRKSEIKTICKTLNDDIACLKKIRATVDKKLKDPKEKAALGDADPYDLVLSSFYRFKRPCPLLTKDGSCSIHPIRPLTCRVYISFSAKQYCRPSRIVSDKALTYLLDLEQDASDLFDELHFMYDVFDGDTSFRSMLHNALMS